MKKEVCSLQQVPSNNFAILLSNLKIKKLGITCAVKRKFELYLFCSLQQVPSNNFAFKFEDINTFIQNRLTYFAAGTVMTL